MKCHIKFLIKLSNITVKGALMKYFLITAIVFVVTAGFAHLISFNSIDVNQSNLLWQLLLLTFFIQWLAFCPAFFLKTEKFYDLTGSLTYCSVFSYVLFVTSSVQGVQAGNLIVATAVMAWAARLGIFLFTRILKDGQDSRFELIKVSFPQFLMTWTLQGMWVFICSSAALVAISSPTGVVVNSMFIFGLAMYVFGLITEIIADHQKSSFRSSKKNKDMFINQGLWARSRHPNYFGEITLWSGIAIMSMPSLSGLNYMALFSPVFTYLLLNYVSGIRLLEARGLKKWGHLQSYHQYCQNTPKLIPRVFSVKND